MSNPKPSNETALSILGQRIRSFREQQGFSLRAFAEKTRIHPSHLSQIELGRINITMETLLCLAYELDVDASELVRPLDNRRTLYLIRAEKDTP